MALLVTYPVSPATPQSGRHQGGQTSQRHAAGDGAAENFGEATERAAALTVRQSTNTQTGTQIATPRDALHFLLESEPLPGPGSSATFVAQQIGQLWIAPDPRIDHGHVAAAYQSAYDAVDSFIAAAMTRTVFA